MELARSKKSYNQIATKYDKNCMRIGISAAPASLQSKMSLDAEFVILHSISNELTVQTKSIKFHFNKNRILL